MPDPTITTAWAGYAKDRFDWMSDRVDEFRNWARQLSTVIAILIGLELTLVGRLVDSKLTTELRYGCLGGVLLSVLAQGILLFPLLHTAYVGRKTFAPESPVALWYYLSEEKNLQEAEQMIGAYYANAHDQFHSLSEKLGRIVGRSTVFFLCSLVPFLIAVLLFVVAALTG